MRLFICCMIFYPAFTLVISPYFIKKTRLENFVFDVFAITLTSILFRISAKSFEKTGDPELIRVAKAAISFYNLLPFLIAISWSGWAYHDGWGLGSFVIIMAIHYLFRMMAYKTIHGKPLNRGLTVGFVSIILMGIGIWLIRKSFFEPEKGYMALGGFLFGAGVTTIAIIVNAPHRQQN